MRPEMRHGDVWLVARRLLTANTASRVLLADRGWRVLDRGGRGWSDQPVATYGVHESDRVLLHRGVHLQENRLRGV